MKHKQLTRELHHLLWFVNGEDDPEKEIPRRGRIVEYLKGMIRSIEGPDEDRGPKTGRVR